MKYVGKHMQNGQLANCELYACLLLALQVDSNDLKTPGWRYNYWELKGVPVRVEVGPRDVQSGTCVMARRDVPGASSL